MEEVEGLIVGMDKLAIQSGRKWPKATASQPKLRESLAKNGLLVPLLINEQHEILDGVWRYIEAKALGWTEIEVHIPETYDEACDKLAEARNAAPETAQPLTNLRAWQIIEALEPLRIQRMQERRDAMWGRKRGERYGHNIRQRGVARERLTVALKLPSETYAQILVRVHRAANDPKNPQQKLAQQLWQELMAEERTAYSAYGFLRRDLDKQKLVTHAATQRKVLKGVMPVADAIITSLRDIGDIAAEITANEAQGWEAKLRELKGAIATTQFKLRNHYRDKRSET